MASDNKEELNNLRYVGENPLFPLLYGLFHTGIPVFIHSNPGEGKTSILKFLARMLEKEIVILSGPQKEPTDLMGVAYMEDAEVPVDPKSPDGPKRKKKVLTFSKPKYAEMAEKHPDMIIFVDELSAATPAVQTCLLSIIQDCVCGDVEIPNTTWRVAAGNYSGMVGVKRLNMALNNRFVHIYFEPEASFTADGFVSGWTNYATPKINSKEDQERKEVQYRILVAKFMRENPSLVSKMPDTFECENDASFPSPRSWMNLVRILSVLDKNEEKYLKELIIGTIGLAAGTLFIRKYLHDVDAFSIDMNAFVGRETTFRIPHPERIDEVFNIVGSTMYYFQKDPKKYYPLWEHVMNVIHNKDGKFGNYAAFDALFMTFLRPSLNLIVSKIPKKMTGIEKRIPDWVMLAGTYGDIRIDK